MKYRIQKFTSRQKDKVYEYTWLGYSYRNEKGKPTFKCVANLSGLPAEVIASMSATLEGDSSATGRTGKTQFLSAMPIGAEAVCRKFAEELGIVEALNSCLPAKNAGIACALVIDRIVSSLPHSRKGLFENYAGTGLARVCGLDNGKLKLQDMYYTLDKLQPCQDEIEKYLFVRNHPAKARLFFYDITSTYFEGDSCILEAFGYNRNRKQGKKQIVIGMLTDSDGLPLSVEVFAGNTPDQTTVMAKIESIRKKIGVEEIVFVGDRGMVTKSRRRDLSAGEYERIKYITALTHEEFNAFLEDDAHPLQPELFDRHNVVEVEHEGVKYSLSFNPEMEERNRTTRDRLLAKTEEALAGIARRVGAGRLKNEQKIARRLFGVIDRWHCAKFFTFAYSEGHFEYARNETKIAEYENLDGFYVFTSDVLDFSAEQIRDEYRKLQKVEQTFRTMKTADLFIRPVRLWNEKRVRAHVFICMLAYMVIWKARHVFEGFIRPEDELRQSLRNVWEELSDIQIATMELGEVKTEQLGRPDGRCRELLKCAGMTLTYLEGKYVR